MFTLLNFALLICGLIIFAAIAGALLYLWELAEAGKKIDEDKD